MSAHDSAVESRRAGLAEDTMGAAVALAPSLLGACGGAKTDTEVISAAHVAFDEIINSPGPAPGPRLADNLKAASARDQIAQVREVVPLQVFWPIPARQGFRSLARALPSSVPGASGPISGG